MKDVAHVVRLNKAGRQAPIQEYIPDGTENDLDLILAGEKLPVRDAEKLKDRLEKNSNDLAARLQLIGFYNTHSNSKTLQQRFEQALWLIVNRPADDLTGHVGSYTGKSQWTSEMKEQAIGLWQTQARQNPNDVKILFHAGLNIGGDECKTLFQKAKMADPKFAPASHWLARYYLRKTFIGSPTFKKRNAELALDEVDVALNLKAKVEDTVSLLIAFTPLAIKYGSLDKARHYAEQLRKYGKTRAFWWQYAQTYLTHLDLLENKLASASKRVERLKASYLKFPTHVASGPASADLALIAFNLGHTQLAIAVVKAMSAGTTKSSERRLLTQCMKQIANGIQPDFKFQ